MTTSMKHARSNSPVRRSISILQLTWSDGTDTCDDNKLNGPTDEQMNASSDGTYYVPVEPRSKKTFHWLERLTTLLLESRDPTWKKTHGKVILFELPKGYRLFEQVRPNSNGKGKRCDTYLYGHPKGPRKRYRSPQEFLPHLVWLASDETKNSANCKCRKCVDGSSGEVAADTISTKDETRLQPAVTSARAVTAAQSRRPSGNTARRPSLQSGPLASDAQHGSFIPSQAAIPENLLLQSLTHRERDNDLTPVGINVYRTGEQVWFQNGAHWSLGVVVDVPMGARNTQGYTIQPIRSPFFADTLAAHAEVPARQLRPWVAWSTPPVTTKILDQPEVDYTKLSWEDARNAPTLEIDASIIKAREIDGSYTLIEKLTDRNQYAGVYLGAEKIWLGDAIRLKSGAYPQVSTGREIVIVNSIQDTSPNLKEGSRTSGTGIIISGDVYRLTASSQKVPTSHALPASVVRDIEARLSCTVPSNPALPHWTYVLIISATNFRLDDVKGRWYPGAALYQIMNEHVTLRAGAGISQQQWDETGVCWNEMGSAGTVLKLGWKRYLERHHAYLKSIPPGVVFGLSQPNPLNAQSLNVESKQPGTNTAVDLTDEKHEGSEYYDDDDDLMRGISEEVGSYYAEAEDTFYGEL